MLDRFSAEGNVGSLGRPLEAAGIIVTVRCNQPSRQAAALRDELAPSHSITSSAIATRPALY
jgi:hypothetical protein